MTGGGRRCWKVHASSVRSSLSTIRSLVYRPSTSWKALIPPMPLATTGGFCCLSRQTRARAFWRGPTWSSSHREATCREADGRPRGFAITSARPRAKQTALAASVVFFDDLFSYDAATDLRASAFLEGLGLLGLACGRRLPARLISEGPCATHGRSPLRGLSREPGCVSGVLATFGRLQAFPILGVCGRTIVVRGIDFRFVVLRLALPVRVIDAARVCTVATARGRSDGFEAEVAADAVLVVGGDVLVVVEARGISYVGLRTPRLLWSFHLRLRGRYPSGSRST